MRNFLSSQGSLAATCTLFSNTIGILCDAIHHTDLLYRLTVNVRDKMFCQTWIRTQSKTIQQMHHENPACTQHASSPNHPGNHRATTRTEAGFPGATKAPKSCWHSRPGQVRFPMYWQIQRHDNNVHPNGLAGFRTTAVYDTFWGIVQQS